MPLEEVKDRLKKHWPKIEIGIWIVILGIAYILMQKAMHPGWAFFGI